MTAVNGGLHARVGTLVNTSTHLRSTIYNEDDGGQGREGGGQGGRENELLPAPSRQTHLHKALPR